MAEALTKMEARIDKKIDDKFNSVLEALNSVKKTLDAQSAQAASQTASFEQKLAAFADVSKTDMKDLQDKFKASTKDNDEKFANLVTEISEASNRQGSENLLSTTQQQERGGGSTPSLAASPFEVKFTQQTTPHNPRMDNLINDANSIRNNQLTDRRTATDAATTQPVTPQETMSRQGSGNVLQVDSVGIISHSFVIKEWVPKLISSSTYDWNCLAVMAPYHATMTLPLTSINMFEANIVGENRKWLQSLPIILDRTDTKRPDQQKMDNAFITQIPAFVKTDKSRFKVYIDRFWDVACRQFCNDHQFVKQMLFDKVYPIFPEICSQDMKPRSIKMGPLTSKGYINQMLLKFQPINEKELSKVCFEGYTQSKKVFIDSYFDEKKRLFELAYGSAPTEQDWHTFFRYFHAGLGSRILAKNMIQEVRHMNMIKPDLDKYRILLIRTAQDILGGAADGIYHKDDAKGCKSFGYSILTPDTNRAKQKGTPNDPIVINQIEPQKKSKNKESSGSESESSSDEESEEIYESDPETESDAGSPDILAVNDKRGRDWVCWYCTKKGHLMTDCYDYLKKKSPHPEGIFVKKEQEKKARRGTKPKPPKKAEKKTKKNKDKKGKKIQQINSEEPVADLDKQDAEAIIADEAAEYLEGVHDLGVLDLPFSDID